MKRALLLASLLACEPAARTLPVVPTAPAAPKAPPAASSLADRAEADTKLLFRLGDASSVLAAFDADHSLSSIERACNVSVSQLHAVSGFVTATSTFRVEVETTLRTADLRCIADALGLPAVAEGDTLRFAGVVVTSENGRVAVTSDPPPKTTGGSALAAPFRARIAATGPKDLVVVGDIAGDAPTEAVLAFGAKNVLSLQLGADRASRASSTLSPLLRKEGLDAVAIRTEGAWLKVEAPSDATLAATLRAKVLEAFKVPSGSMIPTLLVGDHVFVVKDSAVRPIERGDVVAFRQKGSSFLKRVVGLPGDRVQVTSSGALSIGGNPVPTTSPSPYQAPKYGDEPPLRGHVHEETIGHARARVFLTDMGNASVDAVVPKDTVYVLGDNRDNSHDSRAFGPVPMTDVIGRAVVVWAPAFEGPSSWKRVLSTVE